LDKKLLTKKIEKFIAIREEEIEEKIVDVNNLSFINLRDSIIGLGTILDEDFGTQSYVVNVPSGIANRNSAVVVVQLYENQLFLLGYAKEGIINQHTTSKAIEKLLNRVSSFIK
jgi:hypothetical protein